MNMQEQIELSIKHSHQKVLMPYVRKFSDIFERSEVITSEQLSHRVSSKTPSTFAREWHVDELLPRGKIRKGTGRAQLLTFCSVRSASKSWNLDVFPKPEVIELVEKNMMLVDDYRINFEIIIRESGVALVCAHYNMISGSRWFGYVDGETVPKDPERA
jgi:hypothetical protein